MRILGTLLERSFPGAPELRRQMHLLDAEVIDDNGSLSLRPAIVIPAEVDRRIPVEASYDDVDGVSVHGSNYGVFSRPYGTADIQNMRHWGYPMGSNAQAWVYTVRSYCYTGDYFCQNNPNDSNYAIHNSYASDMAYVKQWFDYQLTNPN